MSKHQLQLAGHTRARTHVDEKAVDRLARGARLEAALGISEAQIDALRRQAIALHGAGKWRACVDVVLGVTALGSVHPVDALLLARCYRQLGELEAAEACEAQYEALFRLAVETQGVAEGVRA